jgi:hypothetical protein
MPLSSATGLAVKGHKRRSGGTERPETADPEEAEEAEVLGLFERLRAVRLAPVFDRRMRV